MASGGFIVGENLCLADPGSVGGRVPMDAAGFRGTNSSVLPAGIGVGYHDRCGGEAAPVVCLGEDGGGSVCRGDQPTLHRILSLFDPGDYSRDGEEDEDNSEDEDAPVYLSVDAVDELLPGTTLKCRWSGGDEDDRYAAVFLTADQYLEEGLIGVSYPDDDTKEWISASWCHLDPPDERIWSCDESAPDGGGCDYMIDGDSGVFHRAFRSLARRPKQNRRETDGGGGKSLFLYTDFFNVAEEEGYMDLGIGSPVPVGMDASSYAVVYSQLQFEHPAVQQVDNKLSLYELYKDDPYASRVFPKSYLSYKEALLDTEAEHEDEDNATGDVIFYVKKAGGTRGEEIYIMTWKELSDEYHELKSEGVYDVDDGDAHIVQRAVTDLYTIDGDGPIAGRRFDIRFFVLVARGRAYLHSNMWCKWVLGPRYDPNDTNVEHQVSNLAVYGGGDTARLVFPDVVGDVDGNWWNDSGRRRWGGTTDVNGNRRLADPHGWRDALADALDDAVGVFAALRDLTGRDPTKYALMGGDAMVREDGSIVIVEFNIWADLNSKYERLKECLAGEGCRRMVLLVDSDGDDDSDNYRVTEQTPVTDIVSSEALACVLRDTASLVMQVEPVQEILGFREIIAREEQQD